MTRTLVVGWDGATWSRIDPMLEQGELPNLESIIESGARTNLESTWPPITPLAWTSIATGLHPGNHEIYDFLEQDRNNYEVSPTNFGKLSRAAIWDVFDSFDESIGVLNYPAVYPPPPIDEFFVSGFPLSVRDGITHPTSLDEQLQEAGYQNSLESDPDLNPSGYFEEAIQVTQTQGNVAVSLLDKYDLDMFWTVFMGVDWIQHYLWDTEIEGENCVDQMYRELDNVLGELRDAVDDDWNIVVLSDHGATKLDGKVHLNSLLEKWGYLERSNANNSLSENLVNSVFSNVHNLGRRAPAGIKRTLKRLLPEDILLRMRAQVNESQVRIDSEIDWENTSVFSFGNMGRVFIHTKDEYPQGVVTDEERDNLIEELIEAFESLEHPQNDSKIISNTAVCDSLYGNSAYGNPPDIILEPTDWKYQIDGSFGTSWWSQPESRIADHHKKGILACSGPMFQGGDLDASVEDIMPTLLQIHGLPCPPNIDGSALTSIVNSEAIPDREREISEEDLLYSKESSKFEAEAVQERLDDLGYL